MPTKAQRKKLRREKTARQQENKQRQNQPSAPQPNQSPPPTAPAAQPSTPVAQPTAPAAQPPQELPTLQRWFALVWTNLGGVGVLIALGGIWYTTRQFDLANQSFQRQVGGITARMEFAAAGPRPEHFSKDMRTQAFGKPDWPYFKDLDAFMSLRPKIVMNNIGDDPIEAIRIVTTCFDAELDSDRPVRQHSFLIREEEREEIVLSQQWLPKMSVEVSLVKGILGQMIQVQDRAHNNSMHFAMMRLRISGKITGSAVFGDAGQRELLIGVSWIPSGFPDDKCQELIDKHQSRVAFGARKDVIMSKFEDVVKPTVKPK